MEAWTWNAALLTSTSRLAELRDGPRDRAPAKAQLETSPAIRTHFLPSASTSRCVRAASFSSRDGRSRRPHPRGEKTATARPMPESPPVMSATRPSSFRSPDRKERRRGAAARGDARRPVSAGAGEETAARDIRARRPASPLSPGVSADARRRPKPVSGFAAAVTPCPSRPTGTTPARVDRLPPARAKIHEKGHAKRPT